MCGVALFTHLLQSGSLGSGWYTTLVVSTLLLAVAISRIDMLQVLDLKNLRVTLREIQQAKSDIYAKAEELQTIAIGVADFSAASIVSENRWAGGDHQERMLRRRDDLERFLDNVGVSKPRREELVRPITVTVDWDLRKGILANATAAWKPSPGHAPTDTAARDAMQRRLAAALEQPDRVTGLARAEEVLLECALSSEALSQSIERYRSVLSSGRLPRTGEADDLSRPPMR
ncbi:MAG: hypothetical protein AB1806_00405 [Acidobacteriota bacterium]